MPAYNFKAQFADQVENLKKRQTIRVRGKREPLMLYTGMRQATCRKLLEAVCTSVELIRISTKAKTVQMPRTFGGEPPFVLLDDDEIEDLAKADGFDSAESFFSWFAENHGDTFSGDLIKW